MKGRQDHSFVRQTYSELRMKLLSLFFYKIKPQIAVGCHAITTQMFACVLLCVLEITLLLLLGPVFITLVFPLSIQLAVESLINVNSKSVPYEVKRGLIIEYQCFCLFCNVPKRQQGSSEEKGERRMFFFNDGCGLS